MIKNIVFDFGGVLIDWNPRYLFRHVFADSAEMEFFLENVCTSKWNLNQDAGNPLEKGTRDLQAKFPEYYNEIELYYKNWIQMIGGDIAENSRLVKPLKEKYRLFGLTNWSAETFPLVYEHYPFFKDLEGIVVSGTEKLIKPDKAIFDVLLKRYQLCANECLFIDDNLDNILASKELGFNTLHLAPQIQLEAELVRLKLL
jgi:2-haloacid dehalogenase